MVLACVSLPSTSFQGHQPNQHYYYIHTRARKRTSPLMQFGTLYSCFAGIIGWKQFRKRDRLLSCLALFLCALSLPFRCQPGGERHDMSLAHRLHLVPQGAAHTLAPPFTCQEEMLKFCHELNNCEEKTWQ